MYLLSYFLLLSELGHIYTAKHSFDGSRNERMLSFERGEELEVVNYNAGEWWEVSHLLEGVMYASCMWLWEEGESVCMCVGGGECV